MELYCLVKKVRTEQSQPIRHLSGKLVSVKAEELRKLLTIICCNYGSPLTLLTRAA